MNVDSKSLPWQRIVIKVGSALIAPNRNGCSSQYLLSIANFIVRCRMSGTQVVLVSSGSVAAGAHLFKGVDTSPITIKKAMAAAGQSEMMATWDRLFDFNTAQILLTHADLKNRDRYVSVRDTIEELLDNNILPIINENDTVATDRLKVGDNDNLSAMVASAANADTLVICSDVDGLYDANPKLDINAQLITDVYEINAGIYNMAGGATSDVGTGGMKTKIQAADKAVSHGIDTYIVNGFNESSFNDLLAGSSPGTHFHPHKKPMQDTHHWMKHTTRIQGELVVDDGFMMQKDATGDLLSPQDLLEVSGEFSAGDVVLVRKDNGDKLAKVKTNYSSCLLNFVATQNSEHISEQLDNTDEPILSKQYITLLGV
ncbi:MULTISPECIES: glutamate 5-kinase [Thalassotalea]|uniref:glutamate 5-kinase n=1 Tax=Thalassotalea TaxID=1518149 RepID=UPI000943C7CC|nr:MULTISPECIES: glutamate 5-kinase [Thalassotalea]OKY27476.1 glutamate 5-kinase [Thalassotalea sp. PP2-459]